MAGGVGQRGQLGAVLSGMHNKVLIRFQLTSPSTLQKGFIVLSGSEMRCTERPRCLSQPTAGLGTDPSLLSPMTHQDP